MAARIKPKRPIRLYLAEWRERIGLTQKRAGERLGVSGQDVGRWERAARGDPRAQSNVPNIHTIAALAEAYGIEPDDFYRHPDTPRPGDVLHGLSEPKKLRAIDFIEGLKQAG